MDKNYSVIENRSKTAINKVFAAFKGEETLFEIDARKNGYTEEVQILNKVIKLNEKSYNVHIILNSKFPDELPLVKVPEAKNLLLINPHILEDGYLCILPDSASIDSEKPVEIIKYIIDSVKSILIEAISNDFQVEFTAYWNRSITNSKLKCFVINSPEVLPDKFNIIVREELVAVSSTKESLNLWISNYLGKTSNLTPLENGILLKLSSPLLPKEYPNNLYDLIKLSDSTNKGASNKLKVFITSSYKKGFILLSQKTDNGYALAGILFTGLGLKYKKKIQKGFRPGKTPVDLLVSRSIELLQNTEIIKYPVKRVDYDWIHARSEMVNSYKNKSVVVIGCGSLGGYVAHFLARAGIKKLTLLDNDILNWANIGRHILGAESIAKWKSEALSNVLTSQMPHLNIKGIPKDWRDALKDDDSIFYQADLVITTTADWRCEKPLNILFQNKGLSPIIFGWLEPYAVAGHCFISIKNHGCLACEMNNFGQFNYSVSEFSTSTLKREPGGCTHYQQYGATALLPTASLITTNALNVLKNLPGESILNTWISDSEHFHYSKAIITEKWKSRIMDKGFSRIYKTYWEKSMDCKACN